MVKRIPCRWVVHALLLVSAATAVGQEAGSIRGVVYDQDFDAPLALARVLIHETNTSVTATEQGNYLFPEVPPGSYTLIFSKDGYARDIQNEVRVAAGQMTEVNAHLTGEFEEMEEFIVQDIEIGGGTEEGLLALKVEVPAFLDSVSADWMSRAGASDAAGALRLVSGTTVQEGKYAVVRGLPDRYVNSQMNGVRLPTADADKRAVQLDQFPAGVIESVQVSKTFTPDQQGDASGGAVNVVLKGVPSENLFKFSLGGGFNSQVGQAHDDFLRYEGGGAPCSAERTIHPQGEDINWAGAVGTRRDGAPLPDYSWAVDLGGRHPLSEAVTVGGFASFYYKRESSYYEDGVDESRWVDGPGNPMSPQVQGEGLTPWDPNDPYNPPQSGEFTTKLFDTTKASEERQWGGLGAVGLESENHAISLVYLYTRIAEDEATLAIDTRGKDYYFPAFGGTPAYSQAPNDPMHPGNQNPKSAPWVRTETLAYTERTTETLQLAGRHTLDLTDGLRLGKEGLLVLLPPVLDWTLADSRATLYQPDKRQFGGDWFGPKWLPPNPFLGLPARVQGAQWAQHKSRALFTLGNLQRVWKTIEEESEQYMLNVKFPFEQWSGTEGYVKLGVFNDKVDRFYDQESFSNFDDLNTTSPGEWNEPWSEVFPFQNHPVSGGDIDVDYEGDQLIRAWYYMADVPVTSWLRFIGGHRYEHTDLTIINDPESGATWLPPGADVEQRITGGFYPEGADVQFEQSDILPSVGFVIQPVEELIFRGAYTETVARQTFKELTPIQQMEYLGGPIFVGFPGLKMSALKNYDLRVEYLPYPGGLVSMSWFRKKITLPIEYVQRVSSFTFTTPVNYPKGMIEGWEFEIRQDLGRFWDPLRGLHVGANATFIDSSVDLPQDEIDQLADPQIAAVMTSRDMTQTPEHLYNIFLTYDLESTGTEFSVFYTVKGDTLLAGAGAQSGRFVPNIYALEYGALNVSVSQKIGKYLKLTFRAKNILNPEIETVYRSEYIRDDVVKTSYRKGIDWSLGLSLNIPF